MEKRFEMQWDWAPKESDELSVPKAIYAQEDIRDLLNQKKGPLANFKSGRNGCTDIDDSRNGKAISFAPSRNKSSGYQVIKKKLICSLISFSMQSEPCLL